MGEITLVWHVWRCWDDLQGQRKHVLYRSWGLVSGSPLPASTFQGEVGGVRRGGQTESSENSQKVKKKKRHVRAWFTWRQDLCLDSRWTRPGCRVNKIIGQNLTQVSFWVTKWRSSRLITSIPFPLIFAVSSTRQFLRCLPPCQALGCWWNLNDVRFVMGRNAMKSPNSKSAKHNPGIFREHCCDVYDWIILPCDGSQFEGQDVCRWLGFPKAGLPAVLTQRCLDLRRMKPNHKITVHWCPLNKLCLCELCAGELGNPKYTITIHNPKNWNPCLSQYSEYSLLQHRGHSLLPYKSRLELHAEPTVQKSLWTHLDIVRECWPHDLSWNILSLKKGFGYWTFGQCKKTHRYLEPWGCPKETLSRDFWENLCRATQQMSLMYGAQMDGSDPSKCQKITEQPPQNVGYDSYKAGTCHILPPKPSGVFFSICVLGTFPFANRKLEAKVWKIIQSKWKDLHMDKADMSCGFNFPSYCSPFVA